jgi:hypothetical protein
VVIGDPHRITYSRFVPVTAEVHAVTLGGRDRTLAAFDVGVWEYPRFAWSPDGHEVAYTTADGVWRAPLHGGARELVWRSPRGNLGLKQPMDYDRPVSVAWSSRDELAFSVRRFIPTEPHNPMSGGNERCTVVVVDAGSGQVLLEAAGSAGEGGAGEQWSPDGSRLVFTGSHGLQPPLTRARGRSTIRLPLPLEGTDGGHTPTVVARRSGAAGPCAQRRPGIGSRVLPPRRILGGGADAVDLGPRLGRPRRRRVEQPVIRDCRRACPEAQSPHSCSA